VMVYTDLPAGDIAFALQRIGISVIRVDDLLIAHQPRRDGIANITEGNDIVGQLPAFLRLQAGPLGNYEDPPDDIARPLSTIEEAYLLSDIQPRNPRRSDIPLADYAAASSEPSHSVDSECPSRIPSSVI